jgi:uncharacterized protein
MIKLALMSIAVFAAVSWHSPSTAEVVDDGLAATARGDYVAAAEIWQRLAEGGDVGSQVYLGMAYRDGYGVTKDYNRAVRWFRSAAHLEKVEPPSNAHVDAKYMLGVMIARGQGVSQDHVEAHMWLNLAAAVGYPAVRRQAIAERDRIEALMTPSEITEAQRRAREWRPSSPVKDAVMNQPHR